MTEANRQDRVADPWRVFYTRARTEKKCEKRLRDNRIEVFLPRRTVARQWSDRIQKVSEPLFRNYIFARVNEQDRIAVLRSPGIVRCVTFDGQPATITQDEIERLRIMQCQPERLEPAQAMLPGVGEEVTVDSGPLRGLSGVVIEHRNDTYLVVRIPSVKQSVKVIMPATYTEKFPSST